MTTESAKADVLSPAVTARLDLKGLEALLQALKSQGYCTYAPVVENETLIYGEIETIADLPKGYRDSQKPGEFRLKKSNSSRLFDVLVGQHSLKQFIHLSQVVLARSHRQGNDFVVEEPLPIAPKRAFIGVRPCELAALAIQDKVFLGGPYKDPVYARMREQLFIVAVNCGRSNETCFCASMKTGPRASKGFDLALTEFVEGTNQYFVVESGSRAGAKLVEKLPHTEAKPEDANRCAELAASVVKAQTRSVDLAGLPELLAQRVEDPHWDAIALKCMTCGNCTMACPTCFCTTMEDSTSLTGDMAERKRKWDSCFTLEFSYIHGGSIRTSAAARYRQWLSHKFSSWVPQFGTFGCVGCGRCITWCPVGIDITEELRAMRRGQSTAVASAGNR